MLAKCGLKSSSSTCSSFSSQWRVVPSHCLGPCLSFNSGIAPNCKCGVCAIFICLSVCRHACMHVCLHVCMCVCMCACMHACMHVCVHACMHACVHVCVCVCVCMHACVCACTHACHSRDMSHKGHVAVAAHHIRKLPQ